MTLIDHDVSTDQILWGKVTSLALRNSPARGLRLRDLPELLVALAEVKIASAGANHELGTLDSTRTRAITDAADEVVGGALTDQFPLRVVATGGSTSTNMNVNEVIAARATQLLPHGSTLVIHPNDHVNRSQSTNDVYPTAARVLLVRQAGDVSAALRALASSFAEQAARNMDVVRLGRTAWQEAVQVPVADTHEAHATAMRRFAAQFDAAMESLYAVPLGGTVLGTGVGAPAGFADVAVARLAEVTGLPLVASESRIDAVAHLDRYAALADVAARCASILAKIGEDLRVLSSGPRGGLGEVHLPALQPGSSIMPGKVNPVVPSLIVQCSFSIRAAATAVEMAVGAGDPDINSYTPSIVAALSPALMELAGVVRTFTGKCIDGLTWNKDRISGLASRSFDARIEDARNAGYDAVAARDS